MTWINLPVLALSACALLAVPSAAQESDADLYERMCSSCHSLNPGALAMQGPHMRGVFGRKAGSVRGYLYSPALRSADAVWDEAALFAYLSNPAGFLAGTKKRTAVTDAERLNRVIKYLEATQLAQQAP